MNILIEIVISQFSNAQELAGTMFLAGYTAYDRVIVLTSSGSAGSTTKVTGMTLLSRGASSWRVKQKHSVFLKCRAARAGETLGTACPADRLSVRLWAA
jgi:hypothetical protein